MACPEFADTRTIAQRLGVSVSYLQKLRLYHPEKSPPFISLPPNGRRVVYPLTGENSLETWAAARTKTTGESDGH